MAKTNSFLENSELIGSGLHQKYQLVVIVLSFNQSEFLQQAVDSVLSQVWSQNWHIIIHDDASTDESPHLIRQIAMNNPTKVTAILQTKNRYSNKFNIPMEIQRLVEADYIARLDGDDFFITEDKLVRQVTYLTQNPIVALISHRYAIYDGKNNRSFDVRVRNNGYISKFQLILGNPIATPTAMYRTQSASPLPANFTVSRIQDWPLWVIIASRGKVAYFEDIFSGYRIHNTNGFAQKSNQFFKIDNLHLHKMLSDTLPFPWRINWKLFWALTWFCFKADRITHKKTTTAFNSLRSRIMGYQIIP